MILKVVTVTFTSCMPDSVTSGAAKYNTVSICLYLYEVYIVFAQYVHNDILIQYCITIRSMSPLVCILTFCNWLIHIAACTRSISQNSCTVILSSQVGVAVHDQVLIGGGAREGSVSWDG